MFTREDAQTKEEERQLGECQGREVEDLGQPRELQRLSEDMRGDEGNTHSNDAVYMRRLYVPDVFPKAICCHEELEDAHGKSGYKRSDGKQVIEREFSPCDQSSHNDSKQGCASSDTSHYGRDIGDISNWLFTQGLRDVLRRLLNQHIIDKDGQRNSHNASMTVQDDKTHPWMAASSGGVVQRHVVLVGPQVICAFRLVTRQRSCKV